MICIPQQDDEMLGYKNCSSPRNCWLHKVGHKACFSWSCLWNKYYTLIRVIWAVKHVGIYPCTPPLRQDVTQDQLFNGGNRALTLRSLVKIYSAPAYAGSSTMLVLAGHGHRTDTTLWMLPLRWDATQGQFLCVELEHIHLDQVQKFPEPPQLLVVLASVTSIKPPL